ncbi:sigma-70 family RNA polymerase sigma factor [Aquimarina sp. 2201CG5-10]|uniref:RNA polymerase sigma factor n=1 Tax=Aquimarina callyspongiae TaxID=3098150 RepID=UPI002AB45EC0|nr:sigma-70 family RNA polymerase sigma factor [Aquimarina sp. 2201CG5-10]MDY8134892.1 sigma-70 family RNA polymerase sigma factor [Aquimarina sp. 2201CG5-10]
MPEQKQSVCEEKNFDTLFNTHYESARNYLYYKCGDLQQAEDIVQDAFVKLWKQCADIIYNTAKSLIFKICNNALLNEFAHKKVKLRYEAIPRSDRNNENPEFMMETQEFRIKLELAIGKLSEKEREVFLLSRIDKKTYREIAEITGITVKAVERRMSKAFITLRKLLGKEFTI